MGKEAQLVCVRSSFSKRFDIVSTRKLEQYWLYPKGIKLMHSCGFALREGVFAETKEGICKNKREKS